MQSSRVKLKDCEHRIFENISDIIWNGITLSKLSFTEQPISGILYSAQLSAEEQIVCDCIMYYFPIPSHDPFQGGYMNFWLTMCFFVYKVTF